MSALRQNPPFTLTVLVSLCVVMIVAGALRFSHSNWDGGYQLHPDERAILFVAQDIKLPSSIWQALDTQESPLNPFRKSDGTARSFPYGHFPLYLLVSAQRLFVAAREELALCGHIQAESFAGRALNCGGDPLLDHLTVVGRALSAGYDSLTVLATYCLAFEVFKRRFTALVSASLLAVAVIHIQNAHFATVDAPLTLFCTLAIWLLIRYAARQATADSLAAGLAVGFAAGCKVSGALLVAPLVLTHIESAGRPTSDRGIVLPSLHHPRDFWLTLVCAVCVFAITNPYAVLDPGAFMHDMALQFAIANGSIAPPFTRQYIGTLPVWYAIDQLARWALGLPVALAACLGLGQAIWRAVNGSSQTKPVVVVWVLVMGVIMSSGATKFPRYLMPVIPCLVVLAAGFLTSLQAVSLKGKAILTVVVVFTTALYAAAFVNMYRSPHPWISASQWIYDHIPAGSALVAESNDDVVPLDLSVEDGYHIRDSIFLTRLIDPYAEPDNCRKIEQIAQVLAQSDYMVLASNRLYGVIPRLKSRYPLTTAYYEQLFSGGLGYAVERTWYRYPNLFGWLVINDTFVGLEPRFRPDLDLRQVLLSQGATDESFTVYDHPLVLLLQNRARLSSFRLSQIMVAGTSCTTPGS